MWHVSNNLTAKITVDLPSIGVWQTRQYRNKSEMLHRKFPLSVAQQAIDIIMLLMPCQSAQIQIMLVNLSISRNIHIQELY